ncbi:hypothetical protein ZL39_002157 [Salmonella enterica subsp. enterica]|nr:hypothetical protein [Salmonella enterica subsp. enterica serovar Lexington]EDT2962038.1 hypothetical protein [Salmonella enterica subsp. enterica]EEE2003461.1 hypothetical protein [Salmonella enterica subsp. enterica serovar Kotte]MIF51137.1 hypothetical protein [Salmonella enterica subsp. enterica]
MVKFGVFYHQSWGAGKIEIPLPDLNYIRTNSHRDKESALNVFSSLMEAQKNADTLNSRRAPNQTGQYYVAPTTQDYSKSLKRYSVRGSNVQGWK